ncbi:cytochrome P450 [Rhodococcoides fascians]|uniref:cytochrome P450 n=1 Tax=Rhodococcoides fascians TaxID=1828 RepID=UPI000AE5DA9B|nr:cytochrome P450 [Rhodococcus fascians]
MTDANARDRVVHDFDHLGPEFNANWATMSTEMASERPVSWSPRHDGFWMIAAFDAVIEAGSDPTRFSSVRDGIVGDPFAERDKMNDLANDLTQAPARQGFSIPSNGPYYPRFVPTESDPPLHTGIRRLEVPFFSPKAVRAQEPGVRRNIDRAIDAFIEDGYADFSHQLAMVVPTQTTLKLIGFDEDDWEPLANVVHAMGMGLPQTGELFTQMRERIVALVEDRAREPRSDLASALLQGKIMGTAVTKDEANTILNGITFASTDTTAATLLHGLRYLSAHEQMRAQIIADLSLIPNFIEEVLRLHAPFFGTARTVVRDTELGGQQLEAGERVMLGFGPGNRDPRKFADPDTLKLDRENSRDHLTFGVAHHRCLGAPLARMELKIMFEEILARLPDFHVDEAGIVEYPHKAINGYDKLPATFTPAARKDATA